MSIPSVTTGTDLVEIVRMARLLSDHPERIETAILAPTELLEWHVLGSMSTAARQRRRVQYLSTRFAAKEAALKALAVDSTVPFELSDIEVHGHGAVRIELRGALKNYAATRGITALAGSTAHSGGLASAIIIGVRRYGQ